MTKKTKNQISASKAKKEELELRQINKAVAAEFEKFLREQIKGG